MNIKQLIKNALVGIFFLAALGTVGAMDAEEAESSFKNYCTDIKDGVYPDFKELAEDCEKLD